MKKWFWWVWGLQVLGQVAFALFLMEQSIFVIKAICIYCMSVWIALSFSSWYTLQYMLAENYIGKQGNITRFVRKYHADILLVWFLLIIFLILWEFWYFFGPRLGF